MVIHDFYVGDAFDAYDYFGAHFTEDGVVFRVYAPNAQKIELIGDFNHFSAGTTLGGKTVVENNCFFGMNSVIRGPKTVADYTLVGAGCYISDNTEPYGVYVPARSVHLENKKSTDMM